MTITDDVKTQQIAMQSDSRKGEFCSDANIFNTVFLVCFRNTSDVENVHVLRKCKI